MMIPPKRHVRIFRIAPGWWAYLVTGPGEELPFQGEARNQMGALRHGIWWLKMPEMAEPERVATLAAELSRARRVRERREAIRARLAAGRVPGPIER